MDPLDRDILRSLYGKSKPTYWSISRRLDVPPRIVRNRLQSLMGTSISRIRVFPNLSLFGLRRTTVTAQIDESVLQAMKEKLGLLDFVEGVFVAYPFRTPEGPMAEFLKPSEVYFARFDIAHEPDAILDRKLELMKTVLGDFNVIRTIPFRPARVKIAPTTVAVLRELVKNPLGDIATMAEHLSMTPKTVARHLKILQGSDTFIYQPVIDSLKAKFTIFTIVLFPEPKGGADEINALKEILDSNWLIVGGWTPGQINMICGADTIGEAIAAYERVIARKELRSAVMLMGLQMFDNQTNVLYMQP